MSRASGAALSAWRRDSHRRPPLHYEKPMLLTKKASGKIRYKSITENEKLHFFECDHTCHCMPTQTRRRDPNAFDDARGRLLGNIYFPGHIAFLVAEYLLTAGWIEKPPSVSELAQCRARLRPRGALRPHLRRSGCLERGFRRGPRDPAVRRSGRLHRGRFRRGRCRWARAPRRKELLLRVSVD